MIRRAGQVVLCASAIAAGAGLAWATQPDYFEPRGQFPLAMPDMSAMPALTASHRPAIDPIEIQPSFLEPPAPPAPPEEPEVGAFAESLRDGMVITGATSHRLILFTFDDGPDTRNTPGLLDILDEYGIRAVFFLTAHRLAANTPWAQRNQAVAREIVRRGHIVGNHTVDHAQLPMLASDAARAQVEEASAIIERVLGERSWLMRPPGGGRSARIDGLIADTHHTQVLWNIGTGDYQVRDSASVVTTFQRVLARRERENGERGGIVLLHDTHAWSVEAVPQIVSWLRERNCDFLEQGEELYDIVGDPRYFHAMRGDRSASETAPPAELSSDVLAARQQRLRADTRQRCERVASR